MAGAAEKTKTTRDQDAPVRLVGAGPRRWRWLAAGAGLMVLGALATVMALGQMDQRSGVVVAARDLEPGHVVGERDLMVAQVAGADDLAVIPAGRLGALVGQTVLTPVGERSLIAESAVGEGAKHPGAGEAVVGASLAANQFPASLRSGAQVSLVIADQGERGSGGDASTENSPPSPSAEAIDGRVQSIAPPGNGGEVTRVELVVDSVDAAEAARAASGGSLTVVEVSGGGR
ncbi:SAF domain-containing protein [Murinocardiopsis flavida]|uniref:SAF domain-containing protein n=1 Tax=Murinocardiopsis flavida TaxID=645275 RepID=A0A2P8CY75_9ACTN|nr:SAF domain-containing protein [Murinocardiopsis flavida]PSK89934.1 SAF domain-containing protein [Murinocardiopsis flavida]